MNTVIFNNDTEHAFELSSYNRNTTFNGEQINSTAYMTLRADSSTIEYISSFIQTNITSIILTHDSDVVYQLNNISARITSIDEYLNNDYVQMNINFIFDMSNT